MAEIGIFGSPTYAVELSGIEEMMNDLPDNTANQIQAQDVRNVVFTLYQDIQAGGVTFSYNNPDPLNNPIGKWTTGRTFSNVSLKDLFDGMFYKDVAASAGLSFVPAQTTLDFKQPNTTGYPYNTGFDELVSFQLQWTATKGTFDLIANSGRIDRSPAPVIPTEIQQAGDPLFTAAVAVGGNSDKTAFTKPLLNQTNTYTFTFRDSKNNTISSAGISITYGVRLYWGRKSNKSPVTSSSEITSLNGAGLQGSGEFASTFVKAYNRINGAGDYLCWAFPSSFGEPKFFVSNFRQTEFTKINSQFAFVNQFGYQISYDVWVSNTQQNSPIDDIKLTL